MATEMRLLRLVNQAANKLASVDDVESVLRDVLAILRGQADGPQDLRAKRHGQA